jgi:hypothetical protein
MRRLPSREIALGAILVAVLVVGLHGRGLLAEQGPPAGPTPAPTAGATQDPALAPITDDSQKAFWNVDHSMIEVAPEKRFINPDAGLTEEQRAQRIAEGRERQRQFVRDFSASGEPRSLPRMTIEPYAGPAPPLEISTERAIRIVVAAVTSVDFRPDGAQGPQTSNATLEVKDVLKGPGGLRSLLVTQTGGPVLTTQGPALMQLSSSELMLPGDEVLVFLYDHGPGLPLTAAGVVFFIDGAAMVGISSGLGAQVEGKTQAEVVSLVKAALHP